MDDRRTGSRLSRRTFVAGSAVVASGAFLPRVARRATAQDGAVELTVLDHQEPRLNLMSELLPMFEEAMAAAGTPITVELLEGPAPDTEFRTKLTLDFSSGNAPDVTSFGGGLADFASSGYLLDLSSYAQGWPDWEAHFYPKVREQMTVADGKIYGVPRGASVQQLFYRTDVLAANGISTEQPKSWQELLDRMKQATEAIGEPAILFPAGEAWGGGTFFEGFIHLMLGTDNPIYDPTDQKWVVRSPGLSRVLGFYEEMTTSGVLPVDPLLNPEPWVPTKYGAFPEGKLVATTCGTWCWIFDWGPEGAAPIEDITTKVATWEFPTADGPDTYITGGAGWAWVISAESEHPAEAWELIKWLSSGEAMAKEAVAIGEASPRDDLADVAPYKDYPFLIEAERSLVRARNFTPPAGTDKMVQAVGEATEEIITGRQSGAEAADLLAERATELLGDDLVKQM